MKPTIAIHGGAGTILKENMTNELEKEYLNELETIIDYGYEMLLRKIPSLEVVESVVMKLEDSILFNAGKGSVFTAKGNHEMDAAIMEGRNLQAGAVSMVSNIRNPIQLAKCVLENSEHVFLAGEGANDFARLHNIPFEDDGYFFSEFRYAQWKEVSGTDNFKLDHDIEKKFGTVGAVAFDVFGDLAAATSTGGMTNKKFGRIGDSPLIGAGTYANNQTCAISCTGSGEYFIRGVVAYDVASMMEFKGVELENACNEVINVRLKSIGGDGGLIGVDHNGNIAMVFNTPGMYRASIDKDAVKKVLIYK